MANAKWLAAVAKHQRHIDQINEATEAEWKRRQSTQWGVDLEPQANPLEAEVKMLREELIKRGRQMDILWEERRLARGRGSFLS